MKNLFALLLSLICMVSQAQDITPIVVNIRDNAKLQFSGVAVKQKVTVLSYSPLRNGTKEFCIRASISMYENVSGAYGSKILDLIMVDATLSAEEKIDLLDRYKDREILYTTDNRWVDASGNIVAQGTAGAQTELTYWQSFKLNAASLNMTSASTQGALDAEYKIIIAIITKLNARKNI